MVKLILSILSTLGVLVLVVATFVVHEMTRHPSSIQRTQFANVVWIFAGFAVIAIWAWYFYARGKNRRR